ncbi:MAG: hypothetical protein ACK2UO_23790 [Caldilineaceae bacterium]
MLTFKRALIAALILIAAGVLLLIAMPDEQTLGPVIKVVVLHGVLVQAGLYAFLVAGALGLVWIAKRRDDVLAWCVAVQNTAVAVWIIYALSSMVSTKMAWGQWIAWDEPRVRSSAYVLGFALVALVLTWWVSDALFTALLNVVTAGVVWYLVKGAGVVRHPIDPLGPSTDGVFRMYALALLAIVLCLTILLAWVIHRGGDDFSVRIRRRAATP